MQPKWTKIHYQFFVSTLILVGLLFRGFIRILPTASLIHVGFYLVLPPERLNTNSLKVCKLHQQAFNTRTENHPDYVFSNSIPFQGEEYIQVDRFQIVPE